MGSTGSGVALASFSSRFVEGRRVSLTDQHVEHVDLSPDLRYRVDPNDTFHVEQAYVMSLVPVDAVQQTPVLLVAGGGLTGACWETTPDGRPGWLVRFLQAGLPVDVLDNVERGRAGWAAVPGVWAGEPVVRGERDMWESFRIGRIDDYETRTPFEGSQFPVEALDAMLRQSVPRWGANDALAAVTVQHVLEELGPRVLVGHSHGGGLAARAAASRPDLVRGAVLVEPHGLPTDVVATVPTAVMWCDHLDDSTLWQGLTPLMDAYETALRERGGDVTRLDLPALGIVGNSHNPMMDRNSDEVAALVVDWLARQRDTGALI